MGRDAFGGARSSPPGGSARGPRDDQLLATPEQGTQLLRLGVRQRAGRRANRVGNMRQRAGIQRIRLANWPVARAKSRACRGLTTTTGRPAVANAASARSRPPVASSTIKVGWRACTCSTSVVTPPASLGSVQRSPEGRRAMSSWALPHQSHKAWHVTHRSSFPPDLAHTGSMAPDNCTGLGGQDVTTHAPLRSQRTKAKSVCHVPGLGDGDAPTSPIKDTRL